MSKPGRALLDVNVLIALFTDTHVHHDMAHDWFDENRAFGWATCPLTQNGFLRILGRQDANVIADRGTIFKSLVTLCATKHHEFWPASVTLLDERIFDGPARLPPSQLTDVYLLGLARTMGGRLVTFDSRIPLTVVRGVTRDHLTVIAPA